MAVVHLIRHGQSTWNLEGRVQGRTHAVGLTELGRRQAGQAGEALAALGGKVSLGKVSLGRALRSGVPVGGGSVGAGSVGAGSVGAGGGIDELWSSDLRRARQTADIIGARLGLPVRTAAELREQGLGRLEGLTYDDALEIAATMDWTDPDARVPGGESLREVYQRLAGFFEPRLARPGVCLAVVSHGDTIRVALAVLRGFPVEQVQPEGVANGSITTVRYRAAESQARPEPAGGNRP